MSIAQPVFRSAFTLPAVLGPYNRTKEKSDEPNSRSLCEQFHIFHWPQSEGWAISGEQRANLTEAQKRRHRNTRYFKIDNYVEHAAFESSNRVKMTPVMVIEVKGDDETFTEAKMGETDDYVEDVGEAFMDKFNVNFLYLAVWSGTEAKYFSCHRGIEPKPLTGWRECKEREKDFVALFRHMQSQFSRLGQPSRSSIPGAATASTRPAETLGMSTGYPQSGSLLSSSSYPSSISANFSQPLVAQSGYPQISSSVSTQFAPTSGMAGDFHLMTSSSHGPAQTAVPQTSRAPTGYAKPTRSPYFREHADEYEVQIPEGRVMIAKSKWRNATINQTHVLYYGDYQVYIDKNRRA